MTKAVELMSAMRKEGGTPGRSAIGPCRRRMTLGCSVWHAPQEGFCLDSIQGHEHRMQLLQTNVKMEQIKYLWEVHTCPYNARVVNDYAEASGPSLFVYEIIFGSYYESSIADSRMCPF